MPLVDLTSTRRKAFSRGLLRGFAAPLMIYSVHDLPEEAKPKLLSVENPASRTDGVRGDWSRVGKHLRASMAAQTSVNG